MSQQTHTVALIIKTIPYGETDRISTLFSPILGKFSVFTGKTTSWLQPLSLIEALAHPGKKELFRLKEPKLIDPYFPLRDSFPALKAALEMAEFVSRFIPPSIPKPEIFQLFKVYLGRLHEMKQPANFFYSFILKTYYTEGLLDLEDDGTLTTEEVQFPSYLHPLLTSKSFNDIDSLLIKEQDRELFLIPLS
jgi:DNA repair protein RecO